MGGAPVPDGAPLLDGPTRTEHDTMGEVEVPVAALWGAQTARAVANLPLSGQRMPARVIHALAMVKAAAAATNAELGVLDRDLSRAIVAAADEVATGAHDAHFPVDVFQTGSGTSTNMNVNEVIARLATLAGGIPVHPNDHVNAGQSSNDTFPTAMRVAATLAVLGDLGPALDHLAAALGRQEDAFADAVKSGRTHLMDAVPITLGQEMGGYRTQVERGAARARHAASATAELPLGGTAVGTGLNATPGMAARVVARLSERTGVAFREAENHVEAQSAQDAVVELSGALKVVAVSLTKVANDLRWMSSGPRAGLAEIHLPDLQPGSSIMPGKVNPVICEAVAMACVQVVGNDAAVTMAGASGAFEITVMMPVMARNVLESVDLLASSARLLADKVVDGIVPDRARMRAYAEASPAIATALNPYLGYEAVAAVVKQALADGTSIREAVVTRGHVERGEITTDQLDAALDVDAMARPVEPAG
jgi:fumarate hydratase class II